MSDHIKQRSAISTCNSYNVYFGYLHSHTGISDGSGTPRQAYAMAQRAGLDFFGTSEHDYYPNDMTETDWSSINAAADSYNRDGSFTALVGFEWTSDEYWWVSVVLLQKAMIEKLLRALLYYLYSIVIS